ncbi:hypothetical protein BLNAU_12674 [Blattamonas nauphoetae]|uniref:Uncharacterized protein n=1 Tax=Blattamonas nauphoetae TaxID=2049346 RepID=A0ABQ9XLZ0_9EUKA|nr:hypothetical protein BLNAU_12674 [Blattamonas nauphoetae]
MNLSYLLDSTDDESSFVDLYPMSNVSFTGVDLLKYVSGNWGTPLQYRTQILDLSFLIDPSDTEEESDSTPSEESSVSSSPPLEAQPSTISTAQIRVPTIQRKKPKSEPARLHELRGLLSTTSSESTIQHITSEEIGETKDHQSQRLLRSRFSENTKPDTDLEKKKTKQEKPPYLPKEHHKLKKRTSDVVEPEPRSRRLLERKLIEGTGRHSDETIVHFLLNETQTANDLRAKYAVDTGATVYTENGDRIDSGLRLPDVQSLNISGQYFFSYRAMSKKNINRAIYNARKVDPSEIGPKKKSYEEHRFLREKEPKELNMSPLPHISTIPTPPPPLQPKEKAFVLNGSHFPISMRETHFKAYMFSKRFSFADDSYPIVSRALKKVEVIAQATRSAEGRLEHGLSFVFNNKNATRLFSATFHGLKISSSVVVLNMEEFESRYKDDE